MKKLLILFFYLRLSPQPRAGPNTAARVHRYTWNAPNGRIWYPLTAAH